jgi:hypothetical protein
MNKITVIVLFLLATSQLLSQKGIDLASDKCLSKVFNETEIKGLELMVLFVDDLVFENTNEIRPDRAYHRYFEEIAQSQEYIPFEENMKYQFLKSLDSAQFATTWAFSHNVGVFTYRDSIYRNPDFFSILVIKPYSKYMDYLEEVGKEDSYFKSLRKQMDDVGNISASSAYWFPQNHANFDFDIPKNRLWAAILLLNTEETYDTKLDRYYKNK